MARYTAEEALSMLQDEFDQEERWTLQKIQLLHCPIVTMKSWLYHPLQFHLHHHLHYHLLVPHHQHHQVPGHYHHLLDPDPTAKPTGPEEATGEEGVAEVEEVEGAKDVAEVEGEPEDKFI